MLISPQKVVTLDYVLKDDNDQVLDESRDGSFAYLHGAHNIIPGLENALLDKKTGDQLSVKIAPADGYGERNDSLTQVVSIEMFADAEQVTVGQQFHAQGDHGHDIVVTVTQVEKDQVTIDGNHPLAGVTLNFDVTVLDVRDATQDELQHGHVHGPGCHHH